MLIKATDFVIFSIFFSIDFPDCDVITLLLEFGDLCTEVWQFEQV